MRDALRLHDSIHRNAMRRTQGYEVKTEGDAFMVSFAKKEDALRYCFEVQDDLFRADWPAEILADPLAAEASPSPQEEVNFRGLRVRMGIHWGTPECRPDPTTGRMDYFGPMVNRAARISSAGHGGQILLSKASFPPPLEGLPPARFQDLGDHSLKGIQGSLALVEAQPESLPLRSFPPLKTTQARRTNLGPPREDLLGRGDLFRTTLPLLEGPSRCLSLLGAPGIGKSAFARELASHIAHALDPGAQRSVWWIDLSACVDLLEAASRLALELSLPLSTTASLSLALEDLGLRLKALGPVVLVLDAFDGLVGPAAELISVALRQAPELRILVTSREALEIPEEVRVEVPVLAAGAARELFLEKAQRSRRGFRIRPEDEAELDAFLMDLDYLPQAIELAASRAGMYRVSKLRERWQRDLDSLGSLGRGDRRVGTLRDAFEASWKLLKPREQEVLSRLSLFGESFSPDAVEFVFFDEDDPFEELEGLIRKSMVQVLETEQGSSRFSLFQSLRRFAREKLLGTQLEGEAFAAHARGLERLSQAWMNPEDLAANPSHLFELEAERSNYLEWIHLNLPRDPTGAGRALLALEPLFEARGPVLLQRSLARSILAAGEVQDPLVHAKLESIRAVELAWSGRLAEATRIEAEIEAVLEGLENPREELLFRSQKGLRLGLLGRTFEAIAEIRRALDRSGEEVSALDRSRALWDLAFVEFQGCLPEACLESLARARSLASPRHREFHASCSRLEGEARFALGQLDLSETFLTESLAEATRLGAQRLEAICMRVLGFLALRRGDPKVAQEFLYPALEFSRSIGTTLHSAHILQGLAQASLLEGEVEAALEHLESARPEVEGTGYWQALLPFRIRQAQAEAARGNLTRARTRFEAAQGLLPEESRSSWFGALVWSHAKWLSPEADVAPPSQLPESYEFEVLVAISASLRGQPLFDARPFRSPSLSE